MTIDADAAATLADLGLAPCSGCSTWCDGCAAELDDQLATFAVEVAALDSPTQREALDLIGRLPESSSPAEARRRLGDAIAIAIYTGNAARTRARRSR